MLEYLYRIFIGHNHKWVQVERIPRAAPQHSVADIGGVVYVLKCEVCGKIKQVDVN